VAEKNNDVKEDNIPQDAPAAESAAEEISALECLQEKYDELNDRYLRLMAEYENFRKRSQKEKDDAYSNAAATVLAKFLCVQDNFERAACHDCASEEFAKGFELIEKGFLEVLASFGVEPVGEVGEAFDPDRHHAVSHIEDDCLGKNAVSEVLQKGYKVGDKVLRYAMVQTAN